MFLILSLIGLVSADTLIFEETWDEFNFDRWQHEHTMGGGGNWEFQVCLLQCMLHRNNLD